MQLQFIKHYVNFIMTVQEHVITCSLNKEIVQLLRLLLSLYRFIGICSNVQNHILNQQARTGVWQKFMYYFPGLWYHSLRTIGMTNL
jgi:hypothetical protein